MCFLGYTTTTKGKNLIQAVAPQLARAGVHVHFLGSIVEDWPITWPDRFRKQMSFHGRYTVDEIVTRLQEVGPQLVCILSPMPETFSRILSEAWAAGVPVIVGPVGAQAERVHQTGGGIVLPTLEANAVMEAILELKQNRQAYEVLRAAVKRIAIYSEHDMVREYRTLYRTMLTGNTLQAPREEFVTAIVSDQVVTPPWLSRTGKPQLHAAWDEQTTLKRPEQMRDLMPRTMGRAVTGLGQHGVSTSLQVGLEGSAGKTTEKTKAAIDTTTPQLNRITSNW